MPDAFFQQHEVKDAVYRLADADDLLLFAGAGSSAEAGLPTWPRLLETMLVAVAREILERSGEETDAEYRSRCTGLAQILLMEHSLPAVGAVAQSVFRTRLREKIKRHLYPSDFDLQPGPLAHALARLAMTLDGPAEILTTNYDELLEAALRSQDCGDVVTLVGAELKPVDRPSVRHLHGLIPATGRSRGDVVLSEGDYYLMQDPRNSGEQLVAALLADRPCLFVGTSLDDPNLLRNLYRCSKNRERHVVLYTRQGDAVACDPEIPAPIRRAREEASRRRFASVNVEPLYADFFEQVVQFVNEVALRRELGDEYEYYGERLEAWRAEVVETLLPASPAAFRRCQEEIHGRLAALRDEVLDILDRAGLRRDGQDTLAVQVWTRARHGRELILIGYSDRVWSDAGTLARAVLDRPTPHFAVEVFCYGSPLYQRALPERPGTRWRSALGVPLILTSDPGHRLPVGAITLLSTEKFAGGLLEKLSEAPEEEAEVRTKLIDVGLGLLGSAYGSTTGAR